MPIDPPTILGTEFAKIFLKWGFDKTIGKLDDGKLTKDDTRKLEEAARKYVDNYLHNHGKISVLGMPKPTALEKVYTTVQLIEGRNLWKYQSLHEQEQAYRETAKRSFQSEQCHKQEGIAMANKHQYLMVLGQPGAGKSTFLKRIGLAALQGKGERCNYQIQQKLPGLELTATSEEFYQHEQVPVLIELKRCICEKINLVEKIQSELEICGFTSSEKLTKTLLEQGGMLVLLDGLDEIPSQYLDAAINQIQDFVNKYRQNRFIISCRTAAYQGGFSNLINVEMADFDNERIQQFITNWFSQDIDREVGVANKCWELLSSQDYQATKELAHTPLLLTFLCLVYDDSQTFPKNRSVLYKDALDILLRRWAAEKRINREPIYKDLTIPLEEMLLAKIAYQHFSQDRLFFDKEEVILEIQKHLAENLNAPKYLDGQEILRAIQVQQGILVERSRNILSFSHLTLQEYLTAQYIVDHGLVSELVDKHLNDRRWREVFLLVAGLMRGGADPLLYKMTVAISQLINTDKLCKLFDWASNSTVNANRQVSHIAHRHLALWIAFANARANASIIRIDVDIKITESISKPITMDNIARKAYAHSHDQSYFFNETFTDVNEFSDFYIDTNANNFANSYLDAYANSYIISNSIADSYASAHCVENNNTAELVEDLVEDLAALQIFNCSGIKIKPEYLNKEITFERKTTKFHREFVKKLLIDWYQDLNLELNCLNLSKSEIISMQYCFYASLLVMQCKEAAIDISNKGWAAVEEKMFQVLDNDN